LKTMRDHVFVALDVPSADGARRLIDKLRGEATGFKIGLQLFCNAGSGFVAELARQELRIFLDLKFHDIPNTVARAVRSVASICASAIQVGTATFVDPTAPTRLVRELERWCADEGISGIPEIVGAAHREE